MVELRTESLGNRRSYQFFCNIWIALSLTHTVQKGVTAKVWWKEYGKWCKTQQSFANCSYHIFGSRGFAFSKINSEAASTVFLCCEISYPNLQYYSSFFPLFLPLSLPYCRGKFFLKFQDMMLQSKIITSNKVPATWISLCLLKVMNSNAIITKQMTKNNELSVSSSFSEEWWDKLQSEAVRSWSENTFLKSMHVPEMFSNRQCAFNTVLCW